LGKLGERIKLKERIASQGVPYLMRQAVEGLFEHFGIAIDHLFRHGRDSPPSAVRDEFRLLDCGKVETSARDSRSEERDQVNDLHLLPLCHGASPYVRKL
jgi:hypothetical protein